MQTTTDGFLSEEEQEGAPTNHQSAKRRQLFVQPDERTPERQIESGEENGPASPLYHKGVWSLLARLVTDFYSVFSANQAKDFVRSSASAPVFERFDLISASRPVYVCVVVQ